MIMNFRNFLYIITCISFGVVIGAAVYEHTALWPVAYSMLPKSLAIFQGPYRFDSAPFWIYIHPVTLVLFISTAILTWNTERKKFVLIPLVGYIAVLLITFTYFVPELMDLLGSPYSDTYDVELTGRAQQWVTLSLIRGAFLIVFSGFLLLGLTKSEARVK